MLSVVSACAAMMASAPQSGQTGQRVQASATVAGGGITGQVAAAEGQRLPEMVVFLESRDPAFTFSPSRRPIVVSQRLATFRPSLIVVPVGAKVEFRNDEKGPVEHNVFSKSEAKKFDLGLYKPDDPIQPVTFDTPGAVRLRCSIHRYMDGVVYVAPTPYYCVVATDGRFSISGIKPGAYVLKSWQRSQRFREAEMPVTVTAGKPLSVNVALVR
jgi:plastocyanin